MISLWHWSILSVETYAYNDQVLYTYMLYLSSYIPATRQFLTCEWLQQTATDLVMFRWMAINWNVKWQQQNVSNPYAFSIHLIFARFSSQATRTRFVTVHSGRFAGTFCFPLAGRLTITACTTILLMEYKIIHTLKLKFTSSVSSESKLEDVRKSRWVSMARVKRYTVFRVRKLLTYYVCTQINLQGFINSA